MYLATKSHIKTFLKEQNDSSALKLIEYAKFHELNDSEIIELARGLADSGEKIIPENNVTYCDIPSTGGPSSLSTLICPLFLTLMGGRVIKLGVPGRPAGGIDVLAQIKGYKTNLSSAEIKEWVSQNSYVHFLADQTFAPLDAKLFGVRKKNDALNISSLVIASLLSKKIAVGLKMIGLDIRVSNFGNFGRSLDEARVNAVRFNRIAKAMGIKSSCFIINGNVPQQPYIGRGESILALSKIFQNEADAQLKRHLAICHGMAHSLLGNQNEAVSLFSLKEAFFQNLALQAGNIDHFNRLSEEIEEKNKYAIMSLNSGVLSVDLSKIREAITAIQNRFINVEFPDPCGLILKAMPGQYIEKDTIICSFRCVNEYKEGFETMLADAFGISNQVSEFEIIS